MQVPLHERVDSPLRAGPDPLGSPRTDVAPAPAAEVPAGAAGLDSGRTEELPLRELTGWEEEYLEQHQHDANTAAVCNEVLAMCIVPSGEQTSPEARDRVGALLVAERDRELVRLRRLSLGPSVEAQVVCPSCGGVNEASFSLDDLDVDFAVPARRLRVPLGDDGTTAGVVEVVLPTAADQAALLDAGVESPAERRTWLLGQCVLDSDGAPIGATAARDLSLRQRAVIEQEIEAAAPALDLEMALECVTCGGRFTAPFDIASFFFRNDQAGHAAVARRAPTRARLPLVRAADLEPAAAPPARVSPSARGRRQRGPRLGPSGGPVRVERAGMRPAIRAQTRTP